jgi:Flp pilus assembly protein TadB
MSEAEYLRNVIVYSFAVLAALFGLIGALLVWIYKGDQAKTRERLREHADEARTARDSIARKIDERDAAFNRRFDSQDRVLDGMREAQFDDGQTFRELFHQHDKRIDRLEQEDIRRSMQVRKTDGIS